jgi:glycosyltransferase involved in cell wall biosynthesis
VDVGILPFPKYDGWDVSSPLKLFEYLSCGKPVVVTDIPAHTSVLSGRPFAFWARGNSPEELAAAIRSALGSRDRLAALGAEGRDFVCQRYTWEKQVKLFDEFITSLL